MFEFIAIALIIFLFLNRKKRKKKPRGLDAELKELVENSTDPTGIGLDIKRFLLSVIDDDKNDREKFSDAQIATASSTGTLPSIDPLPLPGNPKLKT